MTKTQIKNNIHSIIENIEDDYVLQQIQDVVQNIAEDKKLSWDSLSKQEKESIEKGLRQIERGEVVDYEEIKKNFSEWLKK